MKYVIVLVGRWINRGEGEKSMFLLDAASRFEPKVREMVYAVIGADAYEKMLRQALRSSNNIIKRNIGLDPYIPESLFEEAYETIGIECLVSNPRLPERFQKIALEKSAVFTLMDLAENQNALPYILSALSKLTAQQDPFGWVGKTVAKNPSLPLEDVQRLYLSGFKDEVRSNPKISREMAENWEKEWLEKRKQTMRGEPKRVEIFVSGKVQDVGYRGFASVLAKQNNITGYVENLSDGKVQLVAEGGKEDIEQFIAGLGRREGVHKIEYTWQGYGEEFSTFVSSSPQAFVTSPFTTNRRLSAEAG